MNLIIWILCGGAFGVLFSMAASNQVKILEYVLINIVTFVIGGFVSTKLVLRTRATHLSHISFSPGGLAVASIIGIFLFLLIYFLILK